MKTELNHAKTDHFSVSFTDTFEVQPFANTDLVLAFRDDDGQFTPNIVFTSEENSAPVSDASVRVLQLTRETYPGVCFPSVDLWGEHLEARRITALYPASESLDVCVRQWVWATGSHHVFATASFLPFQAHWAEETFEAVVHSMVFAMPPQQQSLEQSVQYPLDRELSEVTNVALESLDFIEFSSAGFPGIPIGPEALDLLQRSISQLKFGGRGYKIPKVDRETDAAEELERVGFAQNGTLSPFGETVGLTAARGTRLVNVWSQSEGRMETFTATVREDEVVIVRGEATPHLVVCGVEQVLRHVLEWIGVTPRFVEAKHSRMAPSDAEYRFTLPSDATGWRKITVEIPGVSHFSLIETDTGEVLLSEGIDESTNEIKLVTYPPGQMFDELRSSFWERLGSSVQK